MTNCGNGSWITDKAGYHYVAIDPLTHNPWPTMPAEFLALATSAASQASF